MVLQIAEVPSDPIQKGCRAFTLLELLMASAAFAMIVLVMKVTLMGSFVPSQTEVRAHGCAESAHEGHGHYGKRPSAMLAQGNTLCSGVLGDSQGQG